jgi:hypothetical protein
MEGSILSLHSQCYHKVFASEGQYFRNHYQFYLSQNISFYHKISLSIIKFDSLKACKSYNMYGLGTSHVISCMHNPWGNKSGDVLLCDVLVICTLMHKGCSVCYSSQSYLQWLSCNCSIDKLLQTQNVEDFHVQLIACFSALRFPETNNLIIEKIYCLWYLHKLLNDETFLVVRIKMLMTW